MALMEIKRAIPIKGHARFKYPQDGHGFTDLLSNDSFEKLRKRPPLDASESVAMILPMYRMRENKAQDDSGGKGEAEGGREAVMGVLRLRGSQRARIASLRMTELRRRLSRGGRWRVSIQWQRSPAVGAGQE
jgi:hypothetical protein